MKSPFAIISLIAAASAAESFLNEPDTGLETYLLGTNYTEGTQPPLTDMRGLPDFDWAARRKLTGQQYSFYRVAAAGYRNNLGVWTSTTILGYNFSAPIFISPATRAAYGDPDRAERNLAEAAGGEDILYVPALYASISIEEIAASKRNNTLNGPQVVFQQIYSNANLSVTWDNIRRAEQTGAKAIVWTIDAPGSSTRHRAARYDTTNANSATSALTWDLYDQIANRTSLPIILKGIVTVEDALLAVEKGAKAIYISNHGGRQLEHSASPLEVAYEIHRNAPQIFQQVDVLADSGVRYGTDVLKLLALGVKAVGLGRPFMYANCYGLEGVTKAIQILKAEIAQDAAQAGIANIQNITAKVLNTRALEADVYLMDQ